MALYATDAAGNRIKVAGGGGGSGGGTSGVSSFNGRAGAVMPQAGDYTAEMVGAVGRSMAGETVNPAASGTANAVIAGEGSEIFNDYRNRGFASISGGGQSPSRGNVASGEYSHAEGEATTASGEHTHAEGAYTTASGRDSHAEGYETTASAAFTHAEGYNTTASETGAHAEGYLTISSGEASHAEGTETEAKGALSHAGGKGTIANGFQYAIGTYNVECSGSRTSGDRFIIGNGTSEAERSNAFRVAFSGLCYGSGSWNSSGADYAELFEWQDGNPEEEDRAGLFVTLEGEHIRVAGPEDDYILGVVSAAPSVVGDVYDDQWQGMYIRDVFGRTVQEERDFPALTLERLSPDGTSETSDMSPARRALAPKLNPDYDSTIKYQPRTQRPEWDAVGLLGKLVAVDDGTCQANGWAKVGPGGRATASIERTKYRVMSRLDDIHIKIMIL